MKRGFTLLEMLIVISIIALLASILLTVVGLARNLAKRTKAKHALDQIVMAWHCYYSDNRCFPTCSVPDMNTNVIRILQGDNPRGMFYMEFTTNELKNGFWDPWGTIYQCRVDNGKFPDGAAYDGKVPVQPGAPILTKMAAAWSKAEDKKDTTAAEQRDDIMTW